MKSKSKLIVITILAILLYIIYYSFNFKTNVENYVGRNNVYVLFNFDLNNNYSVKSELNNENSYDKTNLDTYKDQYVTIYINEGVEKISDFFINLPTYIKAHIKSIIFPDSLKRIEKHAFKLCTSLDNLIFPSNIEHIGEEAFLGCTSLKTITYNGNVEYIHNSAFNGTSINQIINPLEIKNELNNYTSENPNGFEFRFYHASASHYAGSNILGEGGEFYIYNELRNNFVQMSNRREHVKTYYSKNDVNALLTNSWYAWEKFVIQKLNDSKSKERNVPTYTMYNRHHKRFIRGNTSYYNHVDGASHSSLTLPSVWEWERWEFIPVPGKINTFYIKSVTHNNRYINVHTNNHLYIWAPNTGYTKNQFIKNKPALPSTDLSSQGKETINNINNYTNKIIELNNSLIEESAINVLTPTNFFISFTGALTSNYILNEYGPINSTIIVLNEGITSLDYSLFKNNSNIKTIIIPTSVTHIHSECFKNCSNLSKVLFVPGSKLKYIYPSAFYNCNNLTEIYFPNSLEIIGAWAFSSCDKLNRVYFNHNSNIKYIDHEAFSDIPEFYAPPQMKYIYTHKDNLIKDDNYITIYGNIANIPDNKKDKYITNTIINNDMDNYVTNLRNRVKVSDHGEYRLFQFNEDCSFQVQSITGEKINSKLIIIGAGGHGGSDGGYWGAGGGGAGEVAMGSYNWTNNETYNVIIGQTKKLHPGGNSHITQDNGNVIVHVWGGGNGMDNPGSAHRGRSDIGSTGGGSGSSSWAPGVESAQKSAKNVSQYFTYYSNRGGHGGSNRGGGGGGGAGGVGGNRWGWEGGAGGVGIQWPINGEWYAGGGAGQGVNDYYDRRPGGKGGGGGGSPGSYNGGNSTGTGYNATPNTGSGGSAAQGRPYVGGWGAAGVCILAFNKSSIDNKEIIINIITDRECEQINYNKNSIDIVSNNYKCLTYQNKLTNKLSISSPNSIDKFGLLLLNYETKITMNNEDIKTTLSTQVDDYNKLVSTFNDVKSNLESLKTKISEQITSYNNSIINDLNTIDVNIENNESVVLSILTIGEEKYNEIYNDWTAIINTINNIQMSQYLKSLLLKESNTIINKINEKIREFTILCKNKIQKIQQIKYSKTNEGKRLERINEIKNNAQNNAETMYKQYVDDLNNDKDGVILKYKTINDDLTNKIKSYGVDEQTIRDDNNLIQNLEYDKPRRQRTIKNKDQEIKQLDKVYRKLQDNTAAAYNKLDLLKYKEKERENNLIPLEEKNNIINAKNSLDVINNQMDYINNNIKSQVKHNKEMLYEYKKNKATNDLIEHTLTEYNKINDIQQKQLEDNKLEREILQSTEQFSNLNKQSYLDPQYKKYILHTETCKNLLKDSELCSIEEYDVDDEDIKIKCLEKELCLNKLKGIEFTNINDLRSSNKEEYNDKLKDKNNHLIDSLSLSLGVLGVLSLIYTIK